MRTQARGFTLIELMVVIGIISVLMGMLVLAIGTKTPRIGAAKMQMSAIAMALATYKSDFQAYPADNVPSTNGSEILHYALCKRFKVGSMHYGPYIQPQTIADRDNNGLKELFSPLNTQYSYAVLIDNDTGRERGCIAIDPGPDKLLGGSLTPNGFIKSGTDANGDGKADDEDNIYSSEWAK